MRSEPSLPVSISNSVFVFRLILVAGLVLMLLSGCAKIQSPPGGPEDRTPPEVVGSTPQHGATNVERTTPVRIEFSEPLREEKIGEAVYISPRPAIQPKFGRDKNAVIIEWPDSLAEATTYLITIAARLADRRGNRLIEPYTLAFSTGLAIDSGSITGIIFRGDRPAANTQVLLFRLPLDSAKTILDIPDYITESGAAGAYRFSYLPAGTYRALAFTDKNKDRLLQPGEDAGCGAFDIQLTALDYQSPPLYLYLQKSDTTLFELAECRFGADNILKIKFSHAIDSLSLPTTKWSITPLTPAAEPRIIAVDYDRRDAQSVWLLLDEVTERVSYRLIVDSLFDWQGQQIDTVLKTCEFFLPSIPDTIPPEITGSSPLHQQREVDSHSFLTIRFSEPVDTMLAGENFILADSTGRRESGKLSWPWPWELVFVPDSVLTDGLVYLMALDSGTVRDQAGNGLPGEWAASFTVIKSENFGGVAGSLAVTREQWQDATLVLEFMPLTGGGPPIRKTTSGPRAYEYQLPAGSYAMQAFIDLNLNQRFDFGSVLPYQPAEPRFFFPDTIEVRARFVTDSVMLTVP